MNIPLARYATDSRGLPPRQPQLSSRSLEEPGVVYLGSLFNQGQRLVSAGWFHSVLFDGPVLPSQSNTTTTPREAWSNFHSAEISWVHIPHLLQSARAITLNIPRNINPTPPPLHSLKLKRHPKLVVSLLYFDLRMGA